MDDLLTLEDLYDILEYQDDDEGDCDRCGEPVPNGHGHWINDDTERVCGDCLPRRR